MWGFFINIGAIVLAFVQFLHAATQHPFYGLATMMISCPVGCGGLAWFIAGLVLRYRKIGNICSGDYLRTQIEADPTAGTIGEAPYAWASGRFMNIYF